MTDWTPPPPGDTREQLPDHILALIDVPPYLSTACETAHQLDTAITNRPNRGAELMLWRDRMHGRCRRNQKFTGQLCACYCHV